MENVRRGSAEGIAILVLAFLVLALIAVGLIGCPSYNVYLQGKSGEAEMAKATANRRIVVTEAQAAAEAATEQAKAMIQQAKAKADAEIERARGVAEANRIIGESLKGNEAYLRYLWITGMGGNADQIVYIPTEAGIPILEAGRQAKKE